MRNRGVASLPDWKEESTDAIRRLHILRTADRRHGCGRATAPQSRCAGRSRRAATASARPAPADKKLDSYLDSWERTMTGLTNFRFELALIRKVDPAATGVFKTDKEYVGVILCMKPNFAILRLDYVPDLNNKEKKKKDYEAFICDGKAVYVYSGLDETITKHKLPDPKTNPAGATDNFILDIMTGMKAKDVKQRFDIKLFNEDQYYIYLDIKPLQDRDKTGVQAAANWPSTDRVQNSRTCRPRCSW